MRVLRLTVLGLLGLVLHRGATAQVLTPVDYIRSEVPIRTYVRIEGENPTRLVGIGLVTGLPGTGDSGKDLVVARPLLQLLTNEANPAEISDLTKTNTVALVAIECEVPANGGRLGDKHDVIVTALNAAKSLRGGSLRLGPMRGPIVGDDVYALASGELIVDDPSVPTRARIREGAQIVREIRMPDLGKAFNLLIKPAYAGRNSSAVIAAAINGEYYNQAIQGVAPVATALDDRTVRIDIPPAEMGDKNGFIGRWVMSPTLSPSLLGLPPRVVVNSATGTIVMTSDVRVNPSLIADAQLVVTSVTPAPGAAAASQVTQNNAIGFRQPSTPTHEEARLTDLLAAFRQLDLPVSRQINILQMLSRAGGLHAELVID